MGIAGRSLFWGQPKARTKYCVDEKFGSDEEVSKRVVDIQEVVCTKVLSFVLDKVRYYCHYISRSSTRESGKGLVVLEDILPYRESVTSSPINSTGPAFTAG